MLIEPRSKSRSGWVLFALIALLPTVAVAALGLRALQNEETAVRRELHLQLQAAADQVRLSFESRLAELRDLPLPTEEELVGPRTMPFVQPVVLSGEGRLLAPLPRDAATKEPRGAPPECAELAARLRSPAAEEGTRRRFLERCETARSESGRHLWPVIALDARSRGLVDASRLEHWLAEHAQLLSDSEREATQLDLDAAGWLPGAARQRLQEQLSAATTASRQLSAVLQAERPAIVAGAQAGRPVRWRNSRSIAELRPAAEGRLAGWVVHSQSLAQAVSRGWPELPPEMTARLLQGPDLPASAVAVELLPSGGASLQIRWARPDTVAARTQQSQLWLLAAGVLAAGVGLGFAAWLFARMRAARRLSELRTDYLAALSHELRTPLASMRMLAELLEQGRVEEGEQSEIHSALAAEARRLGDTVERLLSFSRLERGKLKPALAEVSLPELLGETIDTFERRHPEAAPVTRQLPDEPLRAAVDPELLRLAVDNLLANARRHAPDGKPYTVSLAASGDAVTIAVADRGPGIGAADQRRIFTAFERVDDRLSRATEGAGIGLALVRHVARAHHGKVALESEPGKGATFRLTLPRKARP